MIGSRRLVLARPVRKPPNSDFSELTAPFMRFSISLMSKLPAAISVPFYS